MSNSYNRRHSLSPKAAWLVYVVFAVMALIVASCRAEPSTLAAPTPVSATPVPVTPLPNYEHPRLFFSADEVPVLRENAETTHQEIWVHINEFSDTLLTELPPAAPPVDGDLDTYRNFGNQMLPLAFACVISDDDAICDQGKAYLLRYAEWDQWGNQEERDLGLAHMLIGNAVAYDWLYDRLSPDERQVVRESLADWADKMYEASISPKDETWNNWWTNAYAQNHFTTNHSALGMAGLALLGEDDRAQMWVDHAAGQFALMREFWEGIGDGSWHEGLSYQAYGLTMALPFLQNLRLIQGVDLFPHTYLQNYRNWWLYNYLPGRSEWLLSFANFEWDWGINRHLNVLRFVANEYDDGYAQWVADQLASLNGRFATVYAAPWYVLEFLYYDPDLLSQPPTDLPTDRVFPDLEGVIWRTGWGQDDLAFGFKTGPYGGRFIFDTFTTSESPWPQSCVETGCRLSHGHDHDDTNSFYLFRGGQWLAPEVEGVGDVETSFHNAILIDGQGQFRPTGEQDRDPTAFQGTDGFLTAAANMLHYNYVAADATRRYQSVGDIRTVSRSVLFVRPDYLIISDLLEANRPHQYTWVSHFGESVSIEGDWIRGDAGADQILGVDVISPQDFEREIGDDGRPYIYVQPSDSVPTARFITLLFPTDVVQWPSRPEVESFTDIGDAVFFRVSRNDGDDLTDDVLISYGDPRLNIFPSYSYDGQTAVITRNRNGGVQHFFMASGTFLQDRAANESLVVSSEEIHVLEVVYSGTTTTVSVETDDPTQLSVYVPAVTNTLIVNGEVWPFTRIGDVMVFDIG